MRCSNCGIDFPEEFYSQKAETCPECLTQIKNCLNNQNNANVYDNVKKSKTFGRDINKILLGQRCIVFGIIGFFLPFTLIGIIGNLVWLIVIMAYVLSIYGFFKLMSGLGIDDGSKVLLSISMLIPYINVITMLNMNYKANKYIKSCGYTHGLFGIKEDVK